MHEVNITTKKKRNQIFTKKEDRAEFSLSLNLQPYNSSLLDEHCTNDLSIQVHTVKSCHYSCYAL